MSGKLVSVLIAVGVVSVLSFTGCSPSAELSLKFSPEQTTTYKATTETVKVFRFEQPNLDKLKEEQTKTLVEMVFTQTIESVDKDGNAVAKIMIDDIKIDIVNKNESQLSFDSQSEESKDAPMAKLLGQSYTIQITPEGQVKPLDTKAAASAVTAPYEKKIAKSLFDSKAIVARHQTTALPKDRALLSVDDTWSEVVPSPPGLLAPKSYEKVYTLTAVNGSVATIDMAAGESAKTAEGMSQAAGSMGIFAKMFDNKDDYTGNLKINLATGEVIASAETLTSVYTAQEMPENGDPDKGPDTLTMQFINRILLEKQN